jgi:GNAT-family acetyltransferase (TIGR03103 family)
MSNGIARHRIERIKSPSIGQWGSREPNFKGEPLQRDAVVDCGWGKLVFAHTFEDSAVLARTIVNEQEGRRNLALYLHDPHVVLSFEPQQLFLDPSHTFRLWLADYLPGRIRPSGFSIRRLQRRSDAEQIHRLLLSRRMVSAEPGFVWDDRASKAIQYFVAEDSGTRRIIGTATGIDHAEAFGDPENGSSLWCLAVDPQAQQPGIGRALVAHVADHYAGRGRAFMDLSVMHDNVAVIRLYEDLGFERVPVFCVKKRNAINRDLYVGRQPEAELNPYARIIIDEALRRGIVVDVVDAEQGYFALQCGGRRILCRESLTELTSAIAMSRCDNKVVTHRTLRKIGVRVPEQTRAAGAAANAEFLAKHGPVVVKPARGEQGKGVSVNIADPAELEAAIEQAARTCEEVLLEEYVEGVDLRVVLIDFRVVAAAIRRPAGVVGNGKHTIQQLIEKQSRRRAAATGGESSIPIDAETHRCLKRQGFTLEQVADENQSVRVRETANLHTGGTLHDVTDELGPALRSASEDIAKALDMPVVGLDFIIDSPAGGQYVFIEANERPGLANHEPQPTAARFVDLLFPETAASGAARSAE